MQTAHMHRDMFLILIHIQKYMKKNIQIYIYLECYALANGIRPALSGVVVMLWIY